MLSAMNSATIKQLIDERSAQSYKRYPFVVSRADGPFLWDPEGNRYLDFLAGYAAVPTHMWDVPIDALTRYMHYPSARADLTSNVMYTDTYARFCETICRFTGFDRVLAKCTGGEVCNSVLTAACLHAQKRGIKQPEVIVIEHCFHGRGNHFQALYNGWETVSPKLVQVPHSAEAVEEAINENTILIFMEIHRCEGGPLFDQTDVYPAIHRVARKHDVFIVPDGVQDSFGRCGPQMSWQKWGPEAYRPDAITLAKALGGGIIPVSVLAGTEDFMSVFTPGSDGSTLGGFPLACVIGTAVLEYFEKNPLGPRAEEIGQRIAAHLSGIPHVTVSHEGAMIGFEVEGGGSLEPLCHKMISDLSAPRVFMKHGHSYGFIHHARASPIILGMTDEIIDEACIKTIRPSFEQWGRYIDKQ